jgi:hypothetical protein
MLSLPITGSPLKKSFHTAAGTVDLATDGDVWKTLVDANAPFSRDVDQIAEVSLSPGSALAFGGTQGIGLKVSGSVAHQVQLLWPDRDQAVLAEYALQMDPESDQFYARLLVTAEATVAVNTTLPTGPVATTVGVSAGGHVGYERWILRPQKTAARAVLADLYGRLRLPQHISDVDDLPAAGEVLVSRIGTELTVSSTVGWSHSITGLETLGSGALAPVISYRARLAANATFEYGLAGEFQIEAHRGEAAGWVRFVVRKSRDSKTTLAGHVGLVAEAAVKNVPSSTNEIVAKLLGVHGDRVLDVFDRSTSYADTNQLRSKSGDLVFGVIRKYSEQVLGVPLTDVSLNTVLDAMHRVADAYEKIDGRIIALYNDILDKKAPEAAAIVSTADVILAAKAPEDLVAASRQKDGTFSRIVALLQPLFADKLFDVLRSPDAFSEAVALVRRLRQFLTGDADEQVRKWIAMIREDLPVEQLLADLAKLQTPAAVRAAGDERLKGLTSALAGRKTFSALDDGEIAGALSVVRDNLGKINALKTKLDETIAKNLHQSFEMSVGGAYARARRNERLLDLEVNLAHSDGPRLAELAAGGSLGEILKVVNPDVVRIRKGLFTDELKESASIKLQVLGWSSAAMTTLTQSVEDSIESARGGLIHMYASKTTLEKKKSSGWKFHEELRGTLVVQALAERFQSANQAPRVAGETLKALTSEYNLRRSDEDTRVEELVHYLELADELGLLDMPPLEYAILLRDECGGNLGRVTVTYVVRFDADGLMSAFNLTGGPLPIGGSLGALARQAMRRLFLHRFRGPNPPAPAEVLFAYAAAANDQAFAWHLQHSMRTNLRGIVLPPWVAGTTVPVTRAVTPEMAELVDGMFVTEDQVVEALLKVDALVDEGRRSKPIDFASLNAAIRKLLSRGGALDEDGSLLTAVLDDLIQKGSNGVAQRNSAVIVEAVPRTGPRAGVKATRFLAMGPKNASELAVD